MEDIKRDIILACKYLVRQKLDSGPFGNISIRVPNTQHFWVNPNGVTFDRLKSHDLVCVNTKGEKISGKFDPHPGTFIHQAIYHLRADINAIVHTHSFNTVMISLLGCEIEPFTQLGAALFNDQGLYTGFTGPVRDANEGYAIAQALGDKSIVIAKNHGLFATGAAIHWALWDMIIADEAARIHLAAKQLGLREAEKLDPQFIHKSKVEVRHKQATLVWQNIPMVLQI